LAEHALGGIPRGGALTARSQQVGRYARSILVTVGARSRGAVRQINCTSCQRSIVKPVSEILSKDGDIIEVKLQLTMKFNVKEPVVATKGWAGKKLIGDGTKFPREHIDRYVAPLLAVPPRLLYERG
jgi:hypothetical protein